MSSRQKGTLGRSMIPNFHIKDQTVPTKSKRKRKRSSSSDFPMYGSDQYTDTMLVIKQSRLYEREVRLAIGCIVIMLIILALAPICIIILKKWKWRWLARVMGMRYTDTPTPDPVPVAPTYVVNTNVPTQVAPIRQMVSPLAVQPVPVNPTGSGIDVNRPQYADPSAYKQYMKLLEPISAIAPV